MSDLNTKNAFEQVNAHTRRWAWPALSKLEIVLFVLLALNFLAWLFYGLAILRYPFAVEYAEGPLFNQAAMLARGESIYRSLAAYPFVLANYPPLFPWLISMVFRLDILALWPGRLISLLSALVVGAEIAALVWMWTRRRLPVLFSALLFFTFPAAFVWSSLHRVDMLGLAFSLGALVLVLRMAPSWKASVLISLLLTLSVYTKQTFVFAALAVFLYAWGRNRRDAWRTIALTVGMSGVAGLLLAWQTNGAFLQAIILSNANRFELSRMLLFFLLNVVGVAPLLVCFAFFYVRSHRKRLLFSSETLLIFYLASSLISAALIGKVGSDINYFLELSVALTCVASVVVSRVRDALVNFPTRVTRLAVLLLIFQVVWLPFSTSRFLLPPWRLADATRARNVLLERVQQSTRPVLADEGIDFLVLARQPVLFEPYVFTQLSFEGRWNQSLIVQDLNATRFGMIIMNPRFSALRWTPEMLQAMRTRYKLVETQSGLQLWEPIGSP